MDTSVVSPNLTRSLNPSLFGTGLVELAGDEEDGV